MTKATKMIYKIIISVVIGIVLTVASSYLFVSYGAAGSVFGGFPFSSVSRGCIPHYVGNVIETCNTVYYHWFGIISDIIIWSAIAFAIIQGLKAKAYKIIGVSLLVIGIILAIVFPSIIYNECAIVHYPLSTGACFSVEFSLSFPNNIVAVIVGVILIIAGAALIAFGFLKRR